MTRPEIWACIGLTHCPGSPDGLRHQVRAKPLPAELSLSRFLASALPFWGLSWALFGGWLSLQNLLGKWCIWLISHLSQSWKE